MKKRILSGIVLCAVCISVAGCNLGGWEIGTYYTQGVDVEEFTPALSSIGTTAYLIPDNFLEEFDYVENKFYRYTNEHGFDFGDMDKNLIYLGYSDEVYEEAKNYILTEMDLNLSDEKIYNGYTFYMNYAQEHATGHQEIFPYECNMAGYNDSKIELYL